MFLKIFSIEKNKHETDKQRLLKRSIFLLFLIVISTFAFYMLLLDNMNGEDLSRARNSSSEITQLQKRITNLEKELKMYKEIYGELDLSNINK